MLVIRVDDLRGPEIAALLREHLDGVAVHSPPESIHALDLDGLRGAGITFWSAWRGTELAGCGALKELDVRHGEIKSMRTASAHLRTGVATALLEHLLQEARERGYERLSLETGAQEGFAPARALYARFGFEPCGPFADYMDDPNSVFMTREMRCGFT
jgi:putative acetyltransferase